VQSQEVSFVAKDLGIFQKDGRNREKCDRYLPRCRM